METKTTTSTVKGVKTNVTISGAEAVIKCLLAEGVDILYGYPGGAIMPVYDELYKYQKELHHVNFHRFLFLFFSLRDTFVIFARHS